MCLNLEKHLKKGAFFQWLRTVLSAHCLRHLPLSFVQQTRRQFLRFQTQELSPSL